MDKKKKIYITLNHFTLNCSQLFFCTCDFDTVFKLTFTASVSISIQNSTRDLHIYGKQDLIRHSLEFFPQ